MDKESAKKDFPKWLAVVLVLVLISGLYGFVTGLHNLENYYSPNKVGLFFGSVGFLVGGILSYRTVVMTKIENGIGVVFLFITMGSIGISLMLSTYLNQRFSVVERCDRFQVVDKYQTISSGRQLGKNRLYVDINGQYVMLDCSEEYCNKTSVGQFIDLCLYKSKLGFDFVTVTNDKY